MLTSWTYRLRVLVHLLAVALCSVAAFAAPPPWNAVAGISASLLVVLAAYVWLRLHRQVTRIASEWQLTVDTVDFPLVTVDDAGRVVRMNRAAMERTGRDYRENLGRRLVELGDGEPWETAAGMLATRTGEDGDHRLVDENKAEDPGPRYWEVSVHPVKVDGVRPRSLVLGRDVTDRIRLERELRRREVMSSLGALVGNVAHEARSPLYALRSALDSLRSRLGEDPALIERLDLLQSSADQLVSLMRALLDYGKPIDEELVPVSLERVARRALEDVAAQAEQRRVEVRLRAAADLPAAAMDEDRIFQVLRNLVENAVQHSPEGGRVEVALVCGDGAGVGRVEGWVEDAGEGFRGEDLERAFEPFYSRRVGGTGLGLAIVQRVVEQHGGGVHVENVAGGGGRVRFWLPRSS